MEQRQDFITEQQTAQQAAVVKPVVMQPAWQEGDDAVAVYGAMVYRLAYARLQSRHDADDIFQEVFLRYVRRAPAFASYEHGKAWFLRTTITVSYTHLDVYKRQIILCPANTTSVVDSP